MRARFLAAAFSDGSYLAHVNGAYLRHVTFCIVRGPPLFIVSPICERGSRAAAHLTRRGTPASPILSRNEPLAVDTCIPYFSRRNVMSHFV